MRKFFCFIRASFKAFSIIVCTSSCTRLVVERMSDPIAFECVGPRAVDGELIRKGAVYRRFTICKVVLFLVIGDLRKPFPPQELYGLRCNSYSGRLDRIYNSEEGD